MALVTFISDFGTEDHYVAAVKAALISTNPGVQIVDISHQVRASDISHAGYLLQNVFRDFPANTVHLCAVDNASRQASRLIAVKLEDHYFVGFDSGVFNLISDQKPMAIVDINKVNPIESTFEAKEILAPVAGALARGGDIYGMGPELDQLEPRFGRKPKISKKEIIGHVIRIDHYGNLITNIPKFDFEKIIELNDNKPYLVSFAKESSKTIHKYYQDVDAGDFFIFFNSSGWLQIGINHGNAAELFGIKHDSPVSIYFET